jgi:hypothetical protein
LDGFFAARGMPQLRGRGKKQAIAVAGRRSRRGRPSGLIRPFEVAWGAPIKQTDGDQHDERHRHRQGHDYAGRRKKCFSESTESEGATYGTMAHEFVLQRAYPGAPPKIS